METARIGGAGLGSIYHSPQAASATWAAMSRFADTGGVGLFGHPAGEMTCAGAPLKYTFITDDHLRRRNQRSKAELIYMAQSKSLFGVPIVAEKVRMLFQDRGVKLQHEHVLQSIDLGLRMAADWSFIALLHGAGLVATSVLAYTAMGCLSPHKRTR